ncbi:MAG: M20/M25/M40 family metallo-hydrolase [Caldilineales bacterium]|nr:M20/M25/M40 family metallo-hydrolase [Caldilineales bacterium]
MVDPVTLLQALIRFDTTNPPGNERPLLAYVEELLQDAGLQTWMPARDDNRPNLIARLPGQGLAPPFLLYTHVDVVTTAGQDWRHPPIGGEIHSGEIWGRGAQDSKGPAAMMTSAALAMQAAGAKPPGDVILALVCDEEADGELGAKFLVEEHAEHFAGVRFAIGEGGGFSVTMAGRKFYPIMVGEKQICSLRLTVRGPAGHGSTPIPDTALARTADLIRRLEQGRLPVHIIPPVRQMIETIAAALPAPQRLVMRQLLRPQLSDWLLDRLGESGQLLYPLLHNTVTPTIVRGGEKINVIPCEITLDLDGRLLPGFQPADLVRELRALWGDKVELEVLRFEPCPGEPDMALYPLLADVLTEGDPGGVPLPIILAGVTDARFFSQLGIQTYGFTPADQPDELLATIHAADERIPVEAMRFGTAMIQRVLERLPASM